ncbi:hypothetical protein FRC09_016401 [Ceratobasidium sp. 395]|nr:hypothetical protein FRC09_016401 [Ceratobasidium sp. 395]
MDSQSVAQIVSPTVNPDILDTAEGYECVDGKLVPWTPVVGERKFTLHSKMKCPLCGMIVGVSYSGKRFLALHVGGKRCQRAQRMLNSKSAPKPRRPASGSEPEPESASIIPGSQEVTSGDWKGIREYYLSLGLLRKPWKPKLKSLPESGSSLESSRTSSSPATSDLSLTTVVEDVLLTPPLVPTEFTSPLPPLSLPLPVSSEPAASTDPQVESRCNTGPKYDPVRDRVVNLDETRSHEHVLNPEPLRHPSHKPAPRRMPTPIVIEDSSDDEPGPACVPDTKHKPVHGSVKHERGLGSATCGTDGLADVRDTKALSGTQLPPIVDNSKYVELQAGVASGGYKYWDETPEGQKFLATLRETVGKIE